MASVVLADGLRKHKELILGSHEVVFLPVPTAVSGRAGASGTDAVSQEASSETRSRMVKWEEWWRLDMDIQS
jgi:hypothetical protein